MKVKFNKDVWTIERIICIALVVIAVIAVLLTQGSKAAAKKKYESQIKELNTKVEELTKDNQALLDLIKDMEKTAAEKEKAANAGTSTKTGEITVTETGTVKIKIEKGFKGGWSEVAKRLVSADLIKEEDKQEFIDTVKELEMDTKLQLGTYELDKNMTMSEMILTLCNQ